MAETDLKVSVIVLACDQLNTVTRLIDQLLSQSFPSSDYEVLVVDDASLDGTQAWLRSQADARLRLLLNSRRLGRAKSRNRGVMEAKGELLVMIDGDHSIGAEFLTQHANLHNDELCAIIGRSIYKDYPDYRALNHYLNGSGAVKMERGSLLPGRYFLTGNCSLPKQLFTRYGLFDENFSRWGGEDLDLGARLEDAGIPIYATDTASAEHDHLRPLSSRLENIYHFGNSGIPEILKKHPRMFRELNLDRVLSNPFERDRFNPLLRLFFRMTTLATVYHSAVFVATVFRRHRLPRLLFDYLHFRQYLRGYMDSLEPISK